MSNTPSNTEESISDQQNKDTIREIWNAAKDRLNNPFVLTFLVIFCIRHYKTFFVILSKGEFTTYQKVAFLEEYYHNYSLVCHILTTAIYALVSILIFHAFSIISKMIVDFMNKIIKPQVLKTIDEKEVGYSESIKYWKDKFNQSAKEGISLKTELLETRDKLKNEEANSAYLQSDNNRISIEKTRKNEIFAQNEDIMTLFEIQGMNEFKNLKEIIEFVRYQTTPIALPDDISKKFVQRLKQLNIVTVFDKKDSQGMVQLIALSEKGKKLANTIDLLRL